jgi:predicted O-linked N-acetylglucosamine transferase (SPINDLY family)
MTIETSLDQAVAQHQAGHLQEAEKLYRAILQTNPNHPEANHNMGALAVQREHPASGLPYFIAALEADPARAQYWISYIDALFQAGQAEDAQEVLKLARQQGLEGEAVEALAQHLEGGAKITDSSVYSDNGKNKTKAESAGVSVPQHRKNPSSQEINALVELFDKGQLTEAENLAHAMTVRFPQHWVGWKMLGVVYQQMGRNADALVPMQKALALSPADAEVHNNLGIILQNLDRLEEAEASYRRALKINPDYAQAHGNLGSILQDLGRLGDAEASYRQALKLKPDYVKAHSNLGAVLLDLGRRDEAETSYRRALKLNPDNVDAHNGLGIIHKESGRIVEAEASFQRALTINPDYAEALHNLGKIFQSTGRLDEAEANFMRVIKIDPTHVLAYHNLGVALLERNRLAVAEECFRQAIRIKPDFDSGHNNLGAVLYGLGRLDEAEDSYRQALQINPDYSSAYSNLGVTLQDQGRLEEAEACYRKALQIEPDFHKAHSNLLFCLTLNAKVDAEQLFIEHCVFGEKFESPLRASWKKFTNSRDPERCLQIGLVSGDLREHAVMRLLEPVLAFLVNHDQLMLHVYYNHAAEDSVTKRLRDKLPRWTCVVGMTDDELAQKIREDGIDILVDLSGHSAKNRLLTFARKPAPIQICWLGYPGTTGLSAMDYFPGDRFVMPPGQFTNQFTEKIVYLPAHTAFMPRKESPVVNALPALTNGYVTFGSFNRLNKISPTIVDLWTQLMRALPDSRMLLGGLPEASNHKNLIEWFSQGGIAQDRLSFYGRDNMDQLHHQVDICLDTFPCNGGTTTLHALWMGVPTLTLTGDTIPGRLGACFLSHVGLETFVAQDAADFVQKGLFWAGNLASLSEIRSGLRERFANSAIGQPELIAASLECAMRIMWRRWCAGLPAESFEVTRQEAENAMSVTGL